MNLVCNYFLSDLSIAYESTGIKRTDAENLAEKWFSAAASVTTFKDMKVTVFLMFQN